MTGKAPRRPWPWRLPGKLVEPQVADIVALQAMANGLANAGQQQRAMQFILHDLCEVDVSEFWPGAEDGRRASDFAGGKRFVGLQIRRVLSMKPTAVDVRGAPPAMPEELSSNK